MGTLTTYWHACQSIGDGERSEVGASSRAGRAPSPGQRRPSLESRQPRRAPNRPPVCSHHCGGRCNRAVADLGPRSRCLARLHQRQAASHLEPLRRRLPVSDPDQPDGWWLPSLHHEGHSPSHEGQPAPDTEPLAKVRTRSNPVAARAARG